MQSTERSAATAQAAENQAQLIVCSAAASEGHSALQRLRNWCRLPASGTASAKPALRLHVDDLQGQRVATVADAGPQLVLDLPAGTYQVTAIMGDICRGYTLTLQPGASFNLQLCRALHA